MKINIETNIETFLEFSRNKRLADGTITNYRRSLYKLQELINTKIDLGRWLRLRATATHHTYFVTWNLFAKYNCKEVRTYLKDLRAPRIKNKDPRFLIAPEIDVFKEAVIDPRRRLIILLMLQSGLRIGEVAALQGKHFTTDWVLLMRKGGKQQRLPLTKSQKELFIALRLGAEESLLDVSIRSLQIYVRKLSLRLLGRAISPHSLRHTFATQAIAKSGNIRALSDFLGHTSIKSTCRYMHVIPKDLEDLQHLVSGE